MSKVFTDFLESKRIVHRISCPYTPQQICISERKHRHLIETTLTLMFEANLFASFWFHACSYATFLINRMPSKVLEMKSPYQVLFDKVLEIQNFKQFFQSLIIYYLILILLELHLHIQCLLD